MALQLHWNPERDHSTIDRIVKTRLRCYAPAAKDRELYEKRMLDDSRAEAGDYLLATLDGEDVGTTTSLSMTMWVRGRPLPCQGVAWVGTIKTLRRTGGFGVGGEQGIASQLMHETLRKAREREQVVTALMPFRASFYEHFGYGVVERRSEWLVPLAAMPAGSSAGMRFIQPTDFASVADCRQRAAERGQCDIVTTSKAWELRHKQYEEGFEIVDPTGPAGSIRGWMYVVTEADAGKTIARVTDHAADDHEAFLRQLCFLATLRDQYSFAKITLPNDLPLNRLLRETQLPHRPVDHPAARMHVYTRMQIRVLDHVRFLNGTPLVEPAKGTVTVAIRETEKFVSTIRLEFDEQQLSVKPTQSTADIECTDVTWAAIVSGDLPASTAARLGMLSLRTESAVRLLDAISRGAVPYCGEYF